VRFLITQLFFDHEYYFDFVKEARAAGIDVPIIPGIMPFTNYKQIKRITELCGAKIPDHFGEELEARKDDADALKDLGVAYATLQSSDLLARAAPGVALLHAEPLPGHTRDPLRAPRGAPVGPGGCRRSRPGHGRRGDRPRRRRAVHLPRHGP